MPCTSYNYALAHSQPRDGLAVRVSGNSTTRSDLDGLHIEEERTHAALENRTEPPRSRLRGREAALPKQACRFYWQT